MTINIDKQAINKALNSILDETVQKVKSGYENEALARFAVAMAIQDQALAWSRAVFSGMRFDFRGGEPTVGDR